MKLLAKGFVLLGMGVVFAGCATQNNEVYVPRVPAVAKSKLLDYYEQSGEKVFLIAVDPDGKAAVGYAYGKATQAEAYTEAIRNCDESRRASGVLSRPYFYAINNVVVYDTVIKSANAKKTHAKPEVKKVDEKAPAKKAEAKPEEKSEAKPEAKKDKPAA